VVAHAPVNPAYVESLDRRIVVQANLGKSTRPYSTNNYSERARVVAQVVECLPSKHWPYNQKKKKKKVVFHKWKHLTVYSFFIIANFCSSCMVNTLGFYF
jgi:hypothetical protein